MQSAWAYYTGPQLHALGAGYLTRRGIDIRVLEAFSGRAEVGHTPGHPLGAVSALQAMGFSPDELVDAGLAQRHSSTRALSDFYRQRVLIPVRDDDGHVVGIVGRNLGHPSRPKYKNPSRTAVYDKSVNLYQPLPAPVDRCGQVVVVEGTLDALAIAVTAIRAGRATAFCPVTQSGRELSEAQVRRIISMHAGGIVLGFDGDDAGRDSAARYSRVFARAGKPVSVTSLANGNDPASWLAERGDRALSVWLAAGHNPDRIVGNNRSAAVRNTQQIVDPLGASL